MNSYHSFWLREYALWKVSRPAEDVCSFCYTSHNRHKYTRTSNNASDDDEEESVDDDTRREQQVASTEELEAIME